MQPGDGVARRRKVHRENGHVEGLPPILLVVPEAPQPLLVGAQSGGPPGGELAEEVPGESVVASGNRSVGSKDSVPGDLLAGILERAPSRDKLAHPLEDGESCVTLVHVVGGRVDTDAAQRPDAADAQDELLDDAGAQVAAVEPGGERAIFGGVLGNVRVEEEHRDSSDLCLPDLQEHFAAWQLDANQHLAALAIEGGHDRPALRFQVFVRFLLATLGVEALAEVALSVEDANPDKRDAKIRGALEVVACEDTQAAGVDRERLVHPELRREVGHRTRKVRVGARHPGVAPAEVAVQVAQGPVVSLYEARILGGGSQVGGFPQEPYGVVLSSLP